MLENLNYKYRKIKKQKIRDLKTFWK